MDKVARDVLHKIPAKTIHVARESSKKFLPEIYLTATGLIDEPAAEERQDCARRTGDRQNPPRRESARFERTQGAQRHKVKNTAEGLDAMQAT